LKKINFNKFLKLIILICISEEEKKELLMLRKKKFCILASILITAFLISSSISLFYNNPQYKDSSNKIPKVSANLEGASDVLFTNINRSIDINGFGLINIEDKLTIKNEYNNPISSILFGIPSDIYDNLIFYKANGMGKNILSVEKKDIIMDGNKKMIAIYFNSPLYPDESKTIIFSQSYKDLLNYQITGTPQEPQQGISYTGLIYPLIPYKGQGSIISTINLPVGSGDLNYDNWGSDFNYKITFDIADLPQSHIEPFLENLGENKTVDISFSHTSKTNLQIQKSTREINISPWGVIKVKENILIRNLGSININKINLRIPKIAVNVRTTDHLGEIGGTSVNDLPDNPDSKQVALDLTQNRVAMGPNSNFRFVLSYQLNLGNYITVDWFKQSVQLDIFTTNCDYLIKDQLTKISIEGCLSITEISDPPDAFDNSIATSILFYESDYISNIEDREILFTYSIDFFEMFARPLILFLIIAVVCSAIIFMIKKRKEMGILPIIEREELPLKEIREFCSLYEQKNALTLEIRQAEEELKRRKLTKKQYRNLVDKNESKIKEIDEEIKPFKKEIMEASDTFENIVKKLDVLEAERQTVEDGLKLLESRYKKGKLPSRSAYVKLTNDFLKRRKKIDRTISRFIQQLRSYLL